MRPDRESMGITFISDRRPAFNSSPVNFRSDHTSSHKVWISVGLNTHFDSFYAFYAIAVYVSSNICGQFQTSNECVLRGLEW